jgi:hypothetical protein
MEYRESSKYLPRWSIPQCFNAFPFFSPVLQSILYLSNSNHFRFDAHYLEAHLDCTHTPNFPAPTYHKHIIYYFIILLIILQLKPLLHVCSLSSYIVTKLLS